MFASPRGDRLFKIGLTAAGIVAGGVGAAVGAIHHPRIHADVVPSDASPYIFSNAQCSGSGGDPVNVIFLGGLEDIAMGHLVWDFYRDEGSWIWPGGGGDDYFNDSQGCLPMDTDLASAVFLDPGGRYHTRLHQMLDGGAPRIDPTYHLTMTEAPVHHEETKTILGIPQCHSVDSNVGHSGYITADSGFQAYWQGGFDRGQIKIQVDFVLNQGRYFDDRYWDNTLPRHQSCDGGDAQSSGDVFYIGAK